MKAPLYIFIFFLFSCSATKQVPTKETTGTYGWTGYYGDASLITLYSDSTFRYNWQSGLIQGTTLGSWTQKRNSIILNSHLQPDKSVNDFEVIETSAGHPDTISIKVVSAKNEPVPFVACVLSTDTSTIALSTDFEGEVRFQKIPADSLELYYLGKTERLKLDSSISRYVLEVVDGDGYYQFFTNEEWKLINGRLYCPNLKNDGIVNDYFEKK